jgi:hypothetical protein
MIEIEEKMALKRMVIPRMPGKMNWMYVTPPITPPPGETSLDMPPPTRKSQMRGRAMVEMSLDFSLMNLLNSLATRT